MKLLDILLFPKSFYRKLTDGKGTLFLGVILVGIADIVFNLAEDQFKAFTVNDPEKLLYNVLLTAAAVIVLGIFDVAFFALPLTDLFVFMKKKLKLAEEGGSWEKTAKVYIISHFIIIPVQAAIYAILSIGAASVELQLLAVILFSVLTFWCNAAVARGVLVVYKFPPQMVQLVFLAVFIWNYIMGSGLGYAINAWIMPLFRLM